MAASDRLARSTYSPLLTTRAAALCDLERWDEAKSTIDRANAIESKKGADRAEIMAVSARLKARRA